MLQQLQEILFLNLEHLRLKKEVVELNHSHLDHTRQVLPSIQYGMQIKERNNAQSRDIQLSKKQVQVLMSMQP